MNDLERYFERNPGRLIHKWLHYFEIYDRHFARYRQRPLTLVEIGVYVGEDLHASYWPEYGGGHLDPRSFIEFSTNYIDRLNAYHSRDPQSLPVTDFTRTAHAMHYYDSMLVIEKRPRAAPQDRRTGARTLVEPPAFVQPTELAPGERGRHQVRELIARRRHGKGRIHRAARRGR